MGNREETTERIVAAGLALLTEDGFAGLGVNTLARRSGADKQLIYRYFGGMDGVMAALGERVAKGLAAALEATSGPTPTTYAAMAETLLVALLRHSRADAQYRQMRMMEVVAPSTATEAFRMARGRALSGWVANRAAGLARPEGCDVAAVNAALIAAVEGLTILGAVGLDDPDGARAEAAVRRLVAGAFD